MTNVVASRHWSRNFDDSVDGRWPAGDKPPSFTWAASTSFPSLVNRNIGTPLTFDLRALLTDADPGNTTLSWGTRSGNTARYSNPGSASNTTNNAGTAGTGVQYPIATRPGGVILNGPDLPWSDVTVSVGVRLSAGHYFMLAGNDAYTTAKLNQAASNGFTGVAMRIHPNELEGNTKGDFSKLLPGNLARNFIDDCGTRGLKAIFILLHKEGTGSAASVFPTYWATEDGGSPCYYPYSISPTSGGFCARMDRAAATDRLIAIAQAVGDAFNSLTAFGGYVCILDSAMPNPKPTGWSSTNHITQLERIPPAIVSHFPNSNCFMGFDYMPGNNIEGPVATCAANRVGTFGIDVRTGNVGYNTDLWRVMRGRHADDSGNTGIDYRGVIPQAGHAAGPEMGGKDGTDDAQGFRDDAVTQGVNILMWNDKQFNWPTFALTELFMNNSGSGAVAPFFTPDIQTWMAANHVTDPPSTTCPSTYGTCI